ncbi:ATP-dependent endonuclease [Streptomyces sp. NPDC057677]|uniref:AAA family ATPase n=1 Tax=unclassified Streptomyces TaxID=2593676 RepID=UPI0036999B09
MSFGEIDMELGGESIVITGPNSAGKSNIGRVVDVIRSAIAARSGHPARDRLDLYSRAPRFGARRFTVSMSIELDQPWEKELVATFIRAAYVSSAEETAGRRIPRHRRDSDALRRLDPESLWPLFNGTLRVHYDAGSRQPWRALWQSTRRMEVDCSIDLSSGSRIYHRFRRSEDAGAVSFGEAWVQSFPDRDITARADSPPIDFTQILKHDKEISLNAVVPSDSSSIPDSVRELSILLGKSDLDNQTFDFSQVWNAILQRGVVLTDNRRLPLARSYDLRTLRDPADLQDGSKVPGELYRLKNGPLEQRERFENIRNLFTHLVGCPFEVQATPDPETPEGLLVDVTLPEGGLEYPIAFAGAGRQEALVLSTLVAGDPGRVLILDEPAVHIEPTLQRRLVYALQNRAQCIVITHSSDLVPVSRPSDLMRIVRLSPGSNGSAVRRVPHELDANQQAKWLQRLGAGDARSLLFSAGVVLCEGPTEVGALSTWWENNQHSGWVPPSGSNIALVDVGGDHGFSTYIDFLTVFGIPWTVFADGPALAPGSKLHEYLEAEGMTPKDRPEDLQDFPSWKEYWHNIGVFSVADSFGVDGSKSGEFEAFLERLDIDLYRQVGQDIGRRSKPRIGAAFAARCLPPKDVIDLYHSIRHHLARQ